MATIVIYGPPGTNRTRYAMLFAIAFGCDYIVPDFTSDEDLVPEALHLTEQVPSEVPPGVEVLSVEEALKAFSTF